MSKHILRQLALLKDRVLRAGALSEQAIAQAIAALTEADEASAKRALELHAELSSRAGDIEEECLKSLAMYQPAVSDLRLVVSMLKISQELKRIGDLAKNIAKRALSLKTTDRHALDFRQMAGQAQKMVKECLHALINGDSELAHQVRRDDDVLDRMRRSMHDEIRTAIKQRPDEVEDLLRLYAVAKHLERIGDMATNIAADVIYMVNGDIVRHVPVRDPDPQP